MRKIVAAIVWIFAVLFVSSPMLDDQSATAPTAGATADGAGQVGDEALEDFVPSQKLSADASISFPVDI